MKTKYILVTPVHNEEEFIEQLIRSVIVQMILPQKWVIIDDGSTDQSPEIIKEFENEFGFITYLRFDRRDIENYFDHKVNVVLAGIKEAAKVEHDFLGVLDADITLETSYYKNIMAEFGRNPKLGTASGIYLNKINGGLQKLVKDKNSTAGGLQVFRRECYESIGGFIPLRHGAEDSLMDILARMHGWQSRLFPEYKAIHHRATGTGDGRSVLQARFRQGLTEYGIATHPLFMAVKSFRRAVLEKPYFVGSIVRFAGFLYGYCLREKRQLSPEVIRFVRKEQIGRLWSCIRKRQR